MTVRVDLERLLTAATDATGLGENLAMRHLIADNRIDSAAPGWAGRSAVALSHRAWRWSSTSTAMVTRIGEHATELHTSALSFAATEALNADALHPPDDRVRQLPVRRPGSAIP